MPFLVHAYLLEAKLHEDSFASFAHPCPPWSRASPLGDLSQHALNQEVQELGWMTDVLYLESVSWFLSWLCQWPGCALDYSFQDVTLGRKWVKGTQDLSLLLHTTACESTVISIKSLILKSLQTKNLSKQANKCLKDILQYSCPVGKLMKNKKRLRNCHRVRLKGTGQLSVTWDPRREKGH